MPKRSIRVNELLKREVSQILHTMYRSEAVRITITQVDVSPDLRHGRVYYSVVGDQKTIAAAQLFFKRFSGNISAKAGKHIVLKYFPKLRFVYDPSYERGNKIMELLDDIEDRGEFDEEVQEQDPSTNY